MILITGNGFTEDSCEVDRIIEFEYCREINGSQWLPEKVENRKSESIQHEFRLGNLGTSQESAIRFSCQMGKNGNQ